MKSAFFLGRNLNDNLMAISKIFYFRLEPLEINKFLEGRKIKKPIEI